MFFENEQFNVTRIFSAVLYTPSTYEKRIIHLGCLPTYELMYYIQGNTYVTFNGTRIHMKAGDVLYLPKGIENADYYVDVIEKFQCYNVYFDTDEEMPQEALRIPTSKYELRNLYKRLYTDWLAKRDGYYYKAMQNVYRILELLRKSNQQYMSSASFEYLEAAEEYIAKNYYKPRFKCDKLHELSGLSYSYFNKIFNEKYGMPPVKYVTHLKIRRACELMTTGAFTLEQISEMCGFENVYYFSNIFKKNMGTPPSKFKNIAVFKNEEQKP